MHKLRQRELTYLIEDVTLEVNKLSDGGEIEFYDMLLVAQVRAKLELLGPMQIGTVEVLDSIQYLLSEIRTGHDESEEVYIQVDRAIDCIQDHLDWLAS